MQISSFLHPRSTSAVRPEPAPLSTHTHTEKWIAGSDSFATGADLVAHRKIPAEGLPVRYVEEDETKVNVKASLGWLAKSTLGGAALGLTFGGLAASVIPGFHLLGLATLGGTLLGANRAVQELPTSSDHIRLDNGTLKVEHGQVCFYSTHGGDPMIIANYP